MPVRLRITLFFTLLACLILMLVGMVVFYISYKGRQERVKERLSLRADYIASFYRQEDVDRGVWIHRIDSLTAAPLRDKEIQVFDGDNQLVYQYKDRPSDAFFAVDPELLQKIREEGSRFLPSSNKDVFCVFDESSGIVIITATMDEPGKKQLKQLNIALWVSLAAGTFIALACGYFFAGGLLRPLTRIADRVNEISARNLTQRISTGNTRDEWHYLATTFNQLMDRLQGTLDTHRRFISNASHELSTPLASISTQLGVTLQKERTPEEYKVVISTVYRDALHLSKLTQSLLELAKASDDRGGLEIEPVRVDEIMLQLPAELSRINPGYKVLLQFDNLPDDEGDVVLFGNERLLLTAIKNLAINACKYSPDATAFVRLSTAGDDIKVEVIDNGPGITPDEQAAIFQPFYRGGESKQHSGFGLGLPLAMRIVKLHRGTITVSSDPGAGSVFTVLLPREAAKNRNS